MHYLLRSRSARQVARSRETGGEDPALTVSDTLLLGFREYLIGRALPTRCAGKNVGAPSMTPSATDHSFGVDMTLRLLKGSA
jgi:hypothetical protein